MQTISEKAWFNAIATNDISKVQMFLDQGIDVNIHNYVDLENQYYGSTALHIASKFGYLEMVKLLLAHNADVHTFLVYNCDEATALHLATQELHRDIVELLLQSGAEVNAKNQDGNTALLIASSLENENQDNEYQEIVALLLQYGADIHMRDKEGHTVLRKAVQARNSKAVKVLLDHGADVHELDENKRTLLHHAIYDCCVGCDEDEKKIIIKTLLSHGIDIDAQDARGLTALDYLVINSDEGSDCYRLAEWLLILGASANVQDKNGNTSLHRATEGNLIYPKGFTGIVELLIQYGADVHIKNNNGKTAYAISVDNGNTENSLMSQLLSPESWLHAVISNNIARIKIMLDQGINVNIPDVNGYIALHNAAHAGNKECVALLLAHGANVNARTHGGYTALYHAVAQGHQDIVELLLAHNADVHIQNNAGRTALHIAAERTSKELVEVILAAGADLHAKDHDGQNALHYAIDACNAEVVSLLLARGLDSTSPRLRRDTNHALAPAERRRIDVHAKNKEGITVLHLVAYQKEYNQELMNVLLSYGADVHAQDADGNTPLHRVRNKQCALALLSLGADIEAPNMHGDTALHTASYHGRKKIVEVLLAHGANVHAQNTEGKTVRAVALDQKYPRPIEIIWLLEQYENKQN